MGGAAPPGFTPPVASDSKDGRNVGEDFEPVVIFRDLVTSSVLGERVEFEEVIVVSQTYQSV
jgi:hypothetical protein